MSFGMYVHQAIFLAIYDLEFLITCKKSYKILIFIKYFLIMKMKESLKGLSNVISRISHNNALTGANIKQSYITSLGTI